MCPVGRFGLDATFLTELTDHRLNRRFTGLDFAAESIPLALLKLGAILLDEQHLPLGGVDTKADDVFHYRPHSLMDSPCLMPVRASSSSCQNTRCVCGLML